MPEHDDAQAARELERIPLDLPPGLEIHWLGVSGYRLTYEGVSIFDPHYDNFFSPLGRPPDFVRRVQLAEVPREVRQVARDAQVLALPRVDA
jgi:hypothetical protein